MAERKILLVDDEEVFSDILRRSLIRKGYRTDCACNIKTSMLMLKAEVFDYVIVDLRIGEESGLSLVKLIKNSYPEIIIIMLTGYASIATAIEAIKLGAIHYLTKPAELSDIISAFSKSEGSDLVKPAENPLSIQRMEWEHIQKVLHEHEGNISSTARAMGMHRRTLQRKLQKRPVKK